MRGTALLIGLLLFVPAFAQEEEQEQNETKNDYPFDRWKKETLDSANTAKDVAFMAPEERSIVFYTNLARINPPLFAATYAQKYIDSAENKSSYTASLLRTLKKTKPLPPLLPDSALSKGAQRHAEATGKVGWTGHTGARKRSKKAAYAFWGENCSYGYEHALDIVMQLLVDENVKSLGHRKSILHKDFTHVGAGIRKHLGYGWTGVQNFGGGGARPRLLYVEKQN